MHNTQGQSDARWKRKKWIQAQPIKKIESLSTTKELSLMGKSLWILTNLRLHGRGPSYWVHKNSNPYQIKKSRTFFDLKNIISDIRFNHTGLEHWPSIPDDDRTPQRFRGHFISKKLDILMACNDHDTLSRTF